MDGYNQFFQNPLVMLGAGMMRGADPRGEGLGGLGFGLLNTGQILRQQQQLDVENERARQLADLQMRAFQAKQAQPPKVEAPVAIMGPEGKPIYVTREQALGQQAFKQPLVQVGSEHKLPTGYMWADPLDKQKGVIPIPGGPAAKRAGETAGKEAMIDVAQTFTPMINSLVFEGGDPQGEVRRDVLAGKAAVQMGLPGVMAPEGAKLWTSMEPGIQAITRIETGAAMPPNELENTRRRFEPNLTDPDDVIRLKLMGYNMFLSNAKKYLNPTTGEVDLDSVMADAMKAMQKEEKKEAETFEGLTDQQSQRLRELRQQQGQ